LYPTGRLWVDVGSLWVDVGSVVIEGQSRCGRSVVGGRRRTRLHCWGDPVNFGAIGFGCRSGLGRAGVTSTLLCSKWKSNGEVDGKMMRRRAAEGRHKNAQPPLVHRLTWSVIRRHVRPRQAWDEEVDASGQERGGGTRRAGDKEADATGLEQGCGRAGRGHRLRVRTGDRF